MTERDIRDMAAGAEIDALVAKLVMYGDMRRYSTDIRQAMRVFNCMPPVDSSLWLDYARCMVVGSGNDDVWQCGWLLRGEWECSACAETAELAICQVALLCWLRRQALAKKCVSG